MNFLTRQPLCFFLLFLAAAPAIRAQEAGTARRIDTVYILTPYDLFDTSAGILAEYGIRKPARHWPEQLEKIRRSARGKGANVANIRFYGNLHRGYTAHVSLYYADSSRIAALRRTEGCAVTIFRDNGPSLATFRYDVTVDEVSYKNFQDRHFFRRPVPDCGGPVQVTINGFARDLQMEGRSRYFRLLHRSSGRKARNRSDGDIIGFGNIFLQEIPDELLGRLISEAHEEHLIAPE